MINLEKTKIDSSMLETSRTFLGSKYNKKSKNFDARLNFTEEAIKLRSSTKKTFWLNKKKICFEFFI